MSDHKVLSERPARERRPAKLSSGAAARGPRGSSWLRLPAKQTAKVGTGLDVGTGRESVVLDGAASEATEGSLVSRASRRGVRAVKTRETMVQLMRFQADEKRKKVLDLETMIRDFDGMAGDLDRQIEAEHERTGVRDQNHYAYSTFAKAAAQRRANLRSSVDDLKLRLETARAEFEAALADLRRAEAAEDREPGRRRGDSIYGGMQAARADRP